MKTPTNLPQNPPDEATLILSLVEEDGFEAFQLVAQQINVSHNHAAAIAQLVAIVTAISAALLPGSSMPANTKWIALVGFFVILVSGAIAVGGVLRPTWITEFKPTSKEAFSHEMVERAIGIRRSKSRYVLLSGLILLIGFAFYAASLCFTALW